MNNYSLEVFGQEAEALFAEERPVRAMAELAAESLRKLVHGSLYLNEQQMRGARRNPVRQTLYEDPRGRFALVSVVWPAGYKGPVHEHASWGAMVGYRARLIVTSYRRLDDGTEEGRAQLNEVSRQLVSEGLAALIRPPDDAIHRVENPFREPAMSVHIYGEDAPWPHIFKPAEGTVTKAGKAEHRD